MNFDQQIAEKKGQLTKLYLEIDELEYKQALERNKNIIGKCFREYFHNENETYYKYYRVKDVVNGNLYSTVSFASYPWAKFEYSFEDCGDLSEFEEISLEDFRLAYYTLKEAVDDFEFKYVNSKIIEAISV